MHLFIEYLLPILGTFRIRKRWRDVLRRKIESLKWRVHHRNSNDAVWRSNWKHETVQPTYRTQHAMNIWMTQNKNGSSRNWQEDVEYKTNALLDLNTLAWGVVSIILCSFLKIQPTPPAWLLWLKCSSLVINKFKNFSEINKGNFLSSLKSEECSNTNKCWLKKLLLNKFVPHGEHPCTQEFHIYVYVT